jgi:predicted alpha/beta-fold hydrolase
LIPPNGKAPDRPVPADFRPLPLLRNPHLQTLLSVCLKGPAFRHPTVERLVELPDGDRIALHDTTAPGWAPGGRVALLLHGLSGAHWSPHVVRVARLLLPHGFRVFRMDLRGAGRGALLSRNTYHAGCSDDVRAAAAAIAGWCPGSPLTLVGFSLGGNVALKLAGEAADHPVPGLDRVAAVGPPIDLRACSDLLELPRNVVYNRYFIRHLVAQVRARERLIPGLRCTRFPRQLTLRGFDEVYTAPWGGFADAHDYYRRASALPLLGRIAVPALVLTARDDPFIAVGPFEELRPPPHVRVVIAAHGGHLGFLGADGAGGIRWADRLVAAWVAHPSPSTIL